MHFLFWRGGGLRSDINENIYQTLPYAPSTCHIITFLDHFCSAAPKAKLHLFNVTLTGYVTFFYYLWYSTPTQTRCASNIRQLANQQSNEKGSRHISVEHTNIHKKKVSCPTGYRNAVIIGGISLAVYSNSKFK